MQEFLQQIKNSLDQNQHLNEEAKENIFLMTQVIYGKMQSVYHAIFSSEVSFPTNLIIERLKTLTLKQGSEFLNQEPYEYNIKENTIYFRSKEMDVESQANVLCQSILELAYIKAPNKVERGIDAQKFVAIKKGTLEIFANYIVQNSGEKAIAEEEQSIVNMMNIITDGKILECFLQADGKKLEEIIKNSEFHLIGANSYANYNAVYKNAGQLGNVQQLLIDSFFKLPKEKVNEKLTDFESHIDSKVICRPIRYDKSVSVIAYFQNIKNRFVSGKLYQNEVYQGPSHLQIPQIPTGYEEFTKVEEQRKIS